MASKRAIIAEMMSVAPPGQARLSPAAVAALQPLTAALIDIDTSAENEYRRYLQARQRQLHVLGDTLRHTYSGKRILITGGTGCIGEVLIRQLLKLEAGPIFSLSRGRRIPRRQPNVRYLRGDVGDAIAVTSAVSTAKPDIIFHLAAQRDPGVAERTETETVRTNIFGTRNVLRAAQYGNVERFVHASTGKAVRYYTPGVYAASKKIAEWLLHSDLGNVSHVAAARFTHVVDNSLILQKLQDWANSDLVRLHDPDIAFYVQSGAESAQLLLAAGAADRRWSLQLFAIRDLDLPVELLGMSLGLLRHSTRPAIYFAGYDLGYEESAFPGLYDPHTAGDISPMINAVEAGSATACDHAPQVDQFALCLASEPPPAELLDRLEGMCRAEADGASLRDALGRLGWLMADATFRSADPLLLARLAEISESHGERLSSGHWMQVERLRAVAGRAA